MTERPIATTPLTAGEVWHTLTMLSSESQHRLARGVQIIRRDREVGVERVTSPKASALGSTRLPLPLTRPGPSFARIPLLGALYGYPCNISPEPAVHRGGAPMQNDRSSGQRMLDIVREVCATKEADAKTSNLSSEDRIPSLPLLKDMSQDYFDLTAVLERFTSNAHRD